MTSKPTSFSFGATGSGDAVPKPLTFGLGSGLAAPAATVASVTTAPLGFGGGFSTATTAPTLSFSGSALLGASTPAAPAALPAALVISTTTSTTATAAPSFSFGTSAGASGATTPAIVASFTAPITTTGGGGFTSLTTATKTTDSAAVAHAPQMTYNQLEEHINKWTLELEEQEKVFTDQATQINAWDKILISNNQKILELNDAVQKVKTDQQTLEQELEFIATQHKELEESIAPLQKEFLSIPQVDVERSQTYLLVENLDTQLKQMSEDLKEIIDNLNESNKGQDSTDPIIQIGKILNAHMSSLQWIEASSSQITAKLEQVNKMHDTFKRDSERSLRSAYYK